MDFCKLKKKTKNYQGFAAFWSAYCSYLDKLEKDKLVNRSYVQAQKKLKRREICWFADASQLADAAANEMIKTSIETVTALHKTAHSQKRRKTCESNDDPREAEANDKIPNGEDISFEEGSIGYMLSEKYKESRNINTSKQPAPIQLAASLIANTQTAIMMDWFSEDQWALLRMKVKTI
ncbi:hypothetical protein BGX26_006216, partial [Mortierella sp. AD094]